MSQNLLVKPKHLNMVLQKLSLLSCLPLPILKDFLQFYRSSNAFINHKGTWKCNKKSSLEQKEFILLSKHKITAAYFIHTLAKNLACLLTFVLLASQNNDLENPRWRLDLVILVAVWYNYWLLLIINIQESRLEVWADLPSYANSSFPDCST